jgi:hypothetical protein
LREGERAMNVGVSMRIAWSCWSEVGSQRVMRMFEKENRRWGIMDLMLIIFGPFL